MKTMHSSIQRPWVRTQVISLALSYFALATGVYAVCEDYCDSNLLLTYHGNGAGAYSNGKENTAFGYQAASHSPTGDRNTAVGSRALSGSFDNGGLPNGSGYDNTAIGAQALSQDRAGSYNSASGSQALASNQDGSSNTATGFRALNANASGKENTAVGISSLLYNQTGSYNTAVGGNALANNKVDANTAVGDSAMVNSSTGVQNAALGAGAMYANLTGNSNTASGWGALNSNKDGSYNTATGAESLWSNVAEFNTGDGTRTLYTNSTGTSNTASGYAALYNNTSGSYNTGLGIGALTYNTTGSNNVAVGNNAGANLTTGSNNIDIDANVLGKGGEANVTRIGKTTQAKTFIGGIYNKTVASGVGVMVNSSGQLGTVQSSARYKDDIKPMDKTSEAILALKPVTFRYKEELDPDHIPQFGLIAEQVEKIDPNLIVRDDEGKVMTVRYDAVNAMLLNEFLKEYRRNQEQEIRLAKQEALITKQQEQIEHLIKSVQKVSERIDIANSATHLAGNN